ncbi:MAG: hypothetical protein P8J32_01500 [bacterium]|nr:hypothetical protein [bacterium]
MTESLDTQIDKRADEFFEKNNISVTPENRAALYKMYKAQSIAGHEIERSHDYLRLKVEDFYHPDRERCNVKANAAIAMLANAVNGTSLNTEVFNEMFQFNTGHRTLDANVINTLFDLIRYIAENAGKSFYVDGRNEYTVQLCQDLMRPMKN